MPRFTVSGDFELSGVLAEMGMPSAFSPGEADFSGITGGRRDLAISRVLHKGFIEVNEEGAEAAAASAVAMSKGLRPAVPSFTADRPFLYLIRHNRTGTVLFMGRVVKPTT
jgi:serpin B